MDPQVSVLLAQDAPFVNSMSNHTNKRKHEGEWEDLAKHTTSSTFGSMPEQMNLADAAISVPQAAIVAAASPLPRKNHRRQTLTAAPSLATAELLPLLPDDDIVRDSRVVPDSNNKIHASSLDGDDRCDSITSACSALAISHSSTSKLDIDLNIDTTAIVSGAGTGTSSSWNDLPDDVLRRVLENLPGYALRNVRSVCRGWWQAANRTVRFARPDHLSMDVTSSISAFSHASVYDSKDSTTGGTSGGVVLDIIPTFPKTYLLGRSFPNLRILDLSCCDAVLEMVSPQELGFQSQLQDQALSQLSGLVHLRELILRGCGKITGPGLNHLAVLPALQHVDLTGCTGLTDAGLANGLPGLAHVPALTFLKCTGLTDAAVALLTALPKLEKVAVPPRTTDDGLQILATAAPGLQRVAIRGCPHVGPDGIAALLTAPNLKRVVVSRCPRVTAAALGKVTVNVSVVSCAQAYPGPIIAASTTFQSNGGVGGGGSGGVVGAGLGQQNFGGSFEATVNNNNVYNNISGMNTAAPAAAAAGGGGSPTNTLTGAMPINTTNDTTTTMVPTATRFGGGTAFNNNNSSRGTDVAGVVAPGAAPDLQLMIATFHN